MFLRLIRRLDGELCTFALCNFFLLPTVWAQTSSTPIAPAVFPASSIVLQTSFYGIWQSGQFVTDCQCVFDNGIGYGGSVHFGYLAPIAQNTALVFSLGASGKRFHAAYREYEYFPYRSVRTGDEEIISVLVRNDATGAIVALYGMIEMLFYPFSGIFFLRPAVGIGLNVWDNRRQEQRLEESTVFSPSGEQIRVQWANGASVQVVEDGDFSGLSLFSIFAGITAGTEVKVHRRWYLQFGGQLLAPLLPLNSTGMRLWSVGLSTGVRYEI